MKLAWWDPRRQVSTLRHNDQFHSHVVFGDHFGKTNQERLISAVQTYTSYTASLFLDGFRDHLDA
jgi:hypothetical protein